MFNFLDDRELSQLYIFFEFYCTNTDTVKTLKDEIYEEIIERKRTDDRT